MLYYLLSGRPPFCADDVHDVMYAHLHQEPEEISTVVEQPLPAGLGAVVMHCLRKDPARRYRSAMELAEAPGQVSR